MDPATEKECAALAAIFQQIISDMKVGYHSLGDPCFVCVGMSYRRDREPKPGFHSLALRALRKRKPQETQAHASACVSCGFRLRNASDCV